MGMNRIGKVAISQEGVAALRELAKNLRANDENIKASCDSLQKTVADLAEDLGVFEEPICEMICDIKAVQAKGGEAIENLAERTEVLADKVEELILKSFN